MFILSIVIAYLKVYGLI